METVFAYPLSFLALAFLAALIYASVGHGGASAYLALMALYAFPQEAMRTTALSLNLLVAGTAVFSFARAGCFSWRLTWPFVLSSVPAAFLGGFLSVPRFVYSGLLGISLCAAGARLLMESSYRKERADLCGRPPFMICLVLGGLIGLLSGVIGIGGGIFLSPLLLLFHWAGVKQTAATSAFFIFVNSLSGLLGQRFGHGASLSWPMLGLAFMVFSGGAAGSLLGASFFSTGRLRQVLAGVLFVAAFKLLRFV
jgi:uncharacterized membrane protein YfcA